MDALWTEKQFFILFLLTTVVSSNVATIHMDPSLYLVSSQSPNHLLKKIILKFKKIPEPDVV
jgi:hypothetical protein